MNIRHMVLTIFILVGWPAAVVHSNNSPQLGTYTREQFQDYWYNHGATTVRKFPVIRCNKCGTEKFMMGMPFWCSLPKK